MPSARRGRRAADQARSGVRSRCLHPGQQQGRRWPSSSSSWVRRMRRSRVISCFASSTQQMNSLRAKGVMSFHAASAVVLAISASRRSAGNLCTTPPGTRPLLIGPHGNEPEDARLEDDDGDAARRLGPGCCSRPDEPPQHRLPKLSCAWVLSAALILLSACGDDASRLGKEPPPQTASKLSRLEKALDAYEPRAGAEVGANAVVRSDVLGNTRRP
jgi:hypothetical protein